MGCGMLPRLSTQIVDRIVNLDDQPFEGEVKVRSFFIFLRS